MPEMPLMPALAGEGEEMPVEEMPVEEPMAEGGGGPAEDAKKAVEAAEMYATDAEAIAEKMPDAADAAAAARAAADEVMTLAADVETAQKELDGVNPEDVEAAGAAKAKVDAALAPVMEKLGEAKAACEEAKAVLPLMESAESDLAEWASGKVGGAAPLSE